MKTKLYCPNCGTRQDFAFDMLQENMRARAKLSIEAKEKDAEIARLREIVKGHDDGGHWYSQQTMDAVVKERDALKARVKELEKEIAEHAEWARAQMNNPESEPFKIVISGNAALKAEVERLNKLIDQIRSAAAEINKKTEADLAEALARLEATTATGQKLLEAVSDVRAENAALQARIEELEENKRGLTMQLLQRPVSRKGVEA